MLHKCTNTPYGQPFITADEKSNETLRFPFEGSPKTSQIIVTFDGGEVAQIAELEIENGPRGIDVLKSVFEMKFQSQSENT